VGVDRSRSRPEPSQAELRSAIEHLAALERPPCSDGERQAAEWIAARFREQGLDTRIEQEQVHGTFFKPLGLLAGIAALGGLAALRGRRLVGALAGGFAAASMWEDLSGGRRRWFRRRLRQEPTWNVVAEAGNPEAEATVVLLAHHDAARTSFLFDQSGPRFVVTRMPWLIERLDRWPPVMALVVGGPLLVAAGAVARSRRAIGTGTVLAAGTAAVMADMARQEVVPGANDNLTAVATLLELARMLSESPVDGVRVLLVSTGAEEANQEGIIAFAERHFDSLPVDRTAFLCLETLGSPELLLIEGEGFLRMRDYPDDFKQLVVEAAEEEKVPLRRGLRLTFATDGLIPLRAGYPTVAIGSLNEYLVPSNYHWPTDTPDRLEYDTVASAVRLAYRAVQRIPERLAG
jgi:peptidase M28-like protein